MSGRVTAARGAFAGIVSGAVALAVAYLVAALIAPASYPAAATGELMIDQSPSAVKNFAIREFGSHDKFVLLIGIYVVLGLLAAVIGVLAMRRRAYGVLGVAVFTAVGVTAAATRPGAAAGYVVPALAGGTAAVAVLLWLTRQYVRPALPASLATAPVGHRLAADGDQVALAHGDRVAAADSGDESLPMPTDLQRRRFLVSGVSFAGVAGAVYVAGRLLTERASVATARGALRFPAPATPAPPLPSGADLRIPGLSSFITPNSTFYRVDTAIVLPQVSPESWSLRIHGMVARELTITFDELIHRPLIEDYITLACVSNPVAGPYVGNARWLGASLRQLLREAGIRAGADQLLCTSVDGFTSGTPVQTAMDGRDALVAVAMNGQALPIEHGFPVRLVIPGLYGYVSACKWITDIEVTTYARNVAYWAQRGWSQRAPIKTESRIDVPGTSQLTAGRRPIAGVAWAQHKGIEAVEVRIDRGPWHQATLAPVPDIDTWRQWVWYWNATPGSHLIEARATDKTGYTQTAVQAPPEPNGATGYPSISVGVTA